MTDAIPIGKGYAKAQVQKNKSNSDVCVSLVQAEEEISMDNYVNAGLVGTTHANEDIRVRENETVACITIQNYTQLFLDTDTFSPLETRLISPVIIQQLRLHWKQATEDLNRSNDINMSIKIIKNGDREKATETLVLKRYRNYLRKKLEVQYKRVYWDLIYALMFLIVSILLMFAAGYIAEYWIVDNTDEIPNAVSVLTTLACTYAIQVR